MSIYIFIHEFKDEYFRDNREYFLPYEQGEDFDIESLLNNGNTVNDIKKKYSNKEIWEMENIKASIYYFNSKYKIEYMKKDFYGSDSEFYYEVYYKSRNKYLIITFDSYGRWNHSVIYNFSKKSLILKT